jgi:hypothetical protein
MGIFAKKYIPVIPVWKGGEVTSVPIDKYIGF